MEVKIILKFCLKSWRLVGFEKAKIKNDYFIFFYDIRWDDRIIFRLFSVE